MATSYPGSGVLSAFLPGNLNSDPMLMTAGF